MSTTTNTYVRKRAPKRQPAQTYTGSADVIQFSRGDIHIINRSGGVNATTLADPAGSDEGRELWIINGNAEANTITVSGGLGGSSFLSILFNPDTTGNVQLRAYNGKWYYVSSDPYTVFL